MPEDDETRDWWRRYKTHTNDTIANIDKNEALHFWNIDAGFTLICQVPPQLPASGGEAVFLRSCSARAVDGNPVAAFVLGPVERCVGGFEKVALFKEIQS